MDSKGPGEAKFECTQFSKASHPPSPGNSDCSLTVFLEFEYCWCIYAGDMLKKNCGFSWYCSVLHNNQLEVSEQTLCGSVFFWWVWQMRDHSISCPLYRGNCRILYPFDVGDCKYTKQQWTSPYFYLYHSRVPSFPVFFLWERTL